MEDKKIYKINPFLTFGTRTYVMGILNLTPDSFSGDGLLNKDNALENAMAKADHFVNNGADILDIGGESTRPGAYAISEEEELARVIPVIKALRELYNIPISVDTTKAAIADAAIAAGANLINDVTGLMADAKMAEVAVRYGVPVVLTHNRRMPSIQPSNQAINYWSSNLTEIVSTVAYDLEKLAIHAISRGLTRQQIIMDPGIGFGKNTEQNLALLKYLDKIKNLGYPVLVGASRKSFIGNITNVSVDQRLPGSVAASVIAAFKGADILRVHDVAETVQAMRVLDAMRVI